MSIDPAIYGVIGVLIGSGLSLLGNFLTQKYSMEREERHWQRQKELDRYIPAARKSQNIKWATLDKERIYIFRKKV